MTLLPPAGDGSATRSADPSQGPGSTEPGLTATIPRDGVPIAVPYTWEPGEKPKSVGVVAFTVAAVVFVLAIVGSVLLGVSVGSAVAASAGRVATPSELDLTGSAAVMGGYVLFLGLGSVLGLWGLVQGIVATATGRGRGYGIAAIVLSVLAPVASFLVMSVAIGVATAAATP